MLYNIKSFYDSGRSKNVSELRMKIDIRYYVTAVVQKLIFRAFWSYIPTSKYSLLCGEGKNRETFKNASFPYRFLRCANIS